MDEKKQTAGDFMPYDKAKISTISGYVTAETWMWRSVRALPPKYTIARNILGNANDMPLTILVKVSYLIAESKYGSVVVMFIQVSLYNILTQKTPTKGKN